MFKVIFSDGSWVKVRADDIESAMMFASEQYGVWTTIESLPADDAANVAAAWRFIKGSMFPRYVESITYGKRGDRYSYTTDANKALPMTLTQCHAFCAYMRECGTVGYWK